MFLVEFPIEETMIFNSPREIEIGEKNQSLKAPLPIKSAHTKKT